MIGINEDEKVVPSTTTGEEGKKEEQTVPYSRFKDVNDKLKIMQKGFDELKASVKNNTASKQDKEEYEKLVDLPAGEFAKAIEDRAYNRALESFKEIQNSKQNELDQASQLMDEGFDFLRDSGIKITSAIEKEISQIVLDYNLNLETPKDFEKAYNLYDKLTKTNGAGNSNKAKTLGTVQKNGNGAGKIATNGSWSDVVDRIKRKNGI